MKIGILYSGGFDSTASLLIANSKKENKVIAYMFNYGQDSNEIHEGIRICESLNIKTNVLKTNAYSLIEDRDSFYPARNLLLLQHLFIHFKMESLKYDKIYTGFSSVYNKELTSYPDTTIQFEKMAETLLNISVDNCDKEWISIESPLRFLPRWEIWKLISNMGKEDILKKAYSCFRNGVEKFDWGVGCGKCSKCVVNKDQYELFKSGKMWEND